MLTNHYYTRRRPYYDQSLAINWIFIPAVILVISLNSYLASDHLTPHVSKDPSYHVREQYLVERRFDSSNHQHSIQNGDGLGPPLASQNSHNPTISDDKDNVIIADSSTAFNDECWTDLSSCHKEVLLEFWWQKVVPTPDSTHGNDISPPLTRHSQRGDTGSLIEPDLLKGTHPNARVTYKNGVLTILVGSSSNLQESLVETSIKKRWTLSATGFIPGRWYNVKLVFAPQTGLSLYVDGSQRGHIWVVARDLTGQAGHLVRGEHFLVPRNGPGLEGTLAFVDSSDRSRAWGANSYYHPQQSHEGDDVFQGTGSFVDMQVVGGPRYSHMRTTRSPPALDSRGYPIRGRSGFIPPHPRNPARPSRNSYRISFINNGFIRYVTRDAHILSGDFEIYINFFTNTKDSFVFYAGRDSENIVLQIENGIPVLHINYEYGLRPQPVELLYPPGQEIKPDSQHNLSVKKTGQRITLHVDNQYVRPINMLSNFRPTETGEIYFDFGGTNNPVNSDSNLSPKEYFNGTFYEIAITNAANEQTYPIDLLIQRDPSVTVYGKLRNLTNAQVQGMIGGTEEEGGGITLSFNQIDPQGGSFLSVGGFESRDPALYGGSRESRDRSRDNFRVLRNVSLELMTNEPRGLVFYDDSSTPVALEISNHRLNLVYRDGDVPVRSELYTLPESRLVPFTYILRDNAIHVKAGENEPLEFFLNNPVTLGALYIGGRKKVTRSTTDLPIFATNSFIGCMQGLTIDGSKPKFREDHLNSGTLKLFRVDRCQAPAPRCSRSACYNSGSCREGWNRTYCDCSTTPYSGATCQEAAPTLNLDGNQFMKVILPSNFTSSSTEIALRFRTGNSLNSIVLFADCSSAENVKIYLENGVLKVSYITNGITNIVQATNAYVDDKWHQVEYRKEGPNVVIRIDDERHQRTDPYPQQRPTTIQSLMVGGYEQQQNSYFTGSIQHLMVNGYPILNRDQRPPLPSSQVIYPQNEKREQSQVFNLDGRFYYKMEGDQQRFHPSQNIIRVSVRTNRPEAGVMVVSSPNSAVQLRLSIEKGYPKLLISYEGQHQVLTSNIPVNDGNWHDIKILRSNQVISLQTDQEPPAPAYIPQRYVPSVYQILTGTSQPEDRYQVGVGETPAPPVYVGHIKNVVCDGIDLSSYWSQVRAPPQYNPTPPTNYRLQPPAAPSKGYVPPRPPPATKGPPQRPPNWYPVYQTPQPSKAAPQRPPPPPPTKGYVPRPPQPPPTPRPLPPPPQPPCAITFDGKQYAKIVSHASLHGLSYRNITVWFQTAQDRAAILSTASSKPGENLILYLDRGGVLKLHVRYGTGQSVDKSLQAGYRLNDNRWHKAQIIQNGHQYELSVDDGSPSRNYDQIPGMQPIQIAETYLGYDPSNALSEKLPPLKGEIKDLIINNFEVLCAWLRGHHSLYTVQYPIKIDHTILRYDGNSYMKITVPPEFSQRKTQTISVDFWSDSPNGVIFKAFPIDKSGYLIGELVDGVAKVTYFNDGKMQNLTAGRNLNDNKWHNLEVVLDANNNIRIKVDDEIQTARLPTTKPLNIDIIHVGARSQYEMNRNRIFKGLMRNMTYNGNPIFEMWQMHEPKDFEILYPLAIESNTLQFNGNQYMKVIFPHPNPNNLRNEFHMDFNTKDPNGVLFATLSEPGSNGTYLVGLLENGVLKVIARNGGQTYREIVVGSNLADGQWHRLHVLHDGTMLNVSLENFAPIISQVFDRPTAIQLHEAHFGGFNTLVEPYAQMQGINGFMRDIRVNSYQYINMIHGHERYGHTVLYPLTLTRGEGEGAPLPPFPPTPLPPPIGEPPVIGGAGGIVQSSYDIIRPLRSHLVGSLGPVLGAIAALFPLLAGLIWALYRCKPGLCAGLGGRKGKAVGTDAYRAVPQTTSQGIQHGGGEVTELKEVGPQKGVVGYLAEADKGGLYSQVQKTRRREEEEFIVKEHGASTSSGAVREAHLSDELDHSVRALTRALERDRAERERLITVGKGPPAPPTRYEKETEEYTKTVRYGGGAGGPKRLGRDRSWDRGGPYVTSGTTSSKVDEERSAYDYQIQSINTLNRTTRDRPEPGVKESTRLFDREYKLEEFKADGGGGGSPPYFIEPPRAATLTGAMPPIDSSMLPPGSFPSQSMMAIESLLVTPDNLNVITGSDTVPPQIWNLETGQISKILEGEEGSSDLHLASNDRVLVGLALTEPFPVANTIPKKKLTTWDIDSGNKILTYNKDLFSSLILLNDKRTGVLSSYEDPALSQRTTGHKEVNVTLLDVLNGAVDKRLSYTPTFPLNKVRSFLRKSDNDNYILAGFFEPPKDDVPSTSGGLCNVIIVDLGEIKRGNTDSKAFSMTVTSPETVAILNPDRAITGSPKGELTIWNLDTGKKQGHLKETTGPGAGSAHLGAITAIASSPDGRFLVSASRDTTIKSWQDVGNRDYAHRTTFHGHKSDVTCLDLSKDGKLLASGSLDKMIRLWNFEDGSHLCSFETSTEILNIRISQDNRTIVAIGQRDGVKKLIILKVLP